MLKFAIEEDTNDSELAVKTLRSNSAVKLRNRSLSVGQKVRLKHCTTQRRRLLSHGRAVQMIRRKRATSLPTPTPPATDGSVPPPRTPDESSPGSAGGLQKVRAGVFERSWVDTTAADATVTPSTPAERSGSSSVAEDGGAVTELVSSPAEDTVVSSLTDKTIDAADLSGSLELSVPDEDVIFFV